MKKATQKKTTTRKLRVPAKKKPTAKKAPVKKKVVAKKLKRPAAKPVTIEDTLVIESIVLFRNKHLTEDLGRVVQEPHGEVYRKVQLFVGREKTGKPMFKEVRVVDIVMVIPAKKIAWEKHEGATDDKIVDAMLKDQADYQAKIHDANAKELLASQ